LKVMGHAPALAPPMMEVLNDAIVHLFRNSIDHGLEAAHVRQQLGKMIRGTITIEIEEKAQHVEISYQDDGQGVNLIYAREVMMQKGLLESNQPLTRDMLLKAIFMDGFSTARRLSEVSGRGIGMSAIRTLLQTRGGTFNCEILEESLFDVGYASLRFTMILPLDSVRSQDAS
jgi:chemotaxis protein histidine kinase CheA